MPELSPMLVLLQQPIVVEVGQPAETARITYPEVILGAVGVAGIIMLVAALVGIGIGALIVYRKKRDEATKPVEGTGHVRLGI
ncbi:MAG TPA: hypothetical protein VFX19_13560 [Dehalococcoidia bacterium]|nr:hypothetical protein [Dehalococcoidia bacterium]